MTRLRRAYEAAVAALIWHCGPGEAVRSFWAELERREEPKK